MPMQSSKRLRGQPIGRRGKVLALLAIVLPAMLGVAALVFDAGFMMAEHRFAQHVADAAATAAAVDMMMGRGDETATATAEQYVYEFNSLPHAETIVNIPPQTGPYAGNPNFVETLVSYSVDTRLIRTIGGRQASAVSTRSVAGFEPSTAGAAMVVLDPDPEPIGVAGNPLILGGLPQLVGGLEILGLGRVDVEAAVLVNSRWGGEDENGDPAGESPGPPFGVACMPVLPLSKLRASDIRVVGGVDSAANYEPYEEGEEFPVRANRLPVPDPFAELSVPTTSVDSHVDDTLRGGVTVAGIPLIDPPTVLDPGVYEWISIVSGEVVFNPGVYVIRGVHPVTGVSLSLIAGKVTADGVMFYITDSAGYSAVSGAPDVGDGETEPPPPAVMTMAPSVLINTGLLDSTFRPLDDPASIYDGMFIFQRRHDRRPVVIAAEDILTGGGFAGTVYAKWGHVVVTGKGEWDARLVSGTTRIIAVLDARLAPVDLLPPANDVFLVE